MSRITATRIVAHQMVKNGDVAATALVWKRFYQPRVHQSMAQNNARLESNVAVPVMVAGSAPDPAAAPIDRDAPEEPRQDCGVKVWRCGEQFGIGHQKSLNSLNGCVAFRIWNCRQPALKPLFQAREALASGWALKNAPRASDLRRADSRISAGDDAANSPIIHSSASVWLIRSCVALARKIALASSDNLKLVDVGMMSSITYCSSECATPQAVAA
jgi:hypothetical protein